MNNKAKGTRVELKARGLLEALGYSVTRSAGSYGPFDLIGIHPTHTRCVQVKANRPPDKVEREQLQLLAQAVPAATSVEIWVWKDREKHPSVEVVR